MVKYVVHSPARYVPSPLSRIMFSILHALDLCAIKGPRRPYNNPILRMFLFSSSWKYSGVCLFRRSYAINRIRVVWATQLTFGARASHDAGLRQRRESVGTYVVAIVAKAQCCTTSVARELVRFSSGPVDGGVIFLAFFSDALLGWKNASTWSGTSTKRVLSLIHI